MCGHVGVEVDSEESVGVSSDECPRRHHPLTGLSGLGVGQVKRDRYGETE